MRSIAGRLAAVLLGASALAACVETGDFGRVKRSAWNDAVGATGTLAALARAEPVSFFPFTDAEAELRDRARRFLVPAGDRATLDRLLAELVATRILPAAAARPDLAAYGDHLLADAQRSPVPLYRRLAADAGADARLVSAFVPVARRVLAADEVRLATLAALPDPRAGEVANALGRVAENRCLVAWVSAATAFRLDRYRHALPRLVVAAPDREAVAAERALPALALARSELDALGVRPLVDGSCLSDAALPAPALAPAPVGLVAKG